MLVASLTSSALSSAACRRIVAGDAVGARLVRGPGQGQEASSGGTSSPVPGSRRPVGDQRVVGLQGHEHRAAALGHEVQAVIEELTEEREHRVERGGQTDVWCLVADEAGTGRPSRRSLGCGDRSRVGLGLIDDDVADESWVRVGDDALGLLVARRRDLRCWAGTVEIDGLALEVDRCGHTRENGDPPRRSGSGQASGGLGAVDGAQGRMAGDAH